MVLAPAAHTVSDALIYKIECIVFATLVVGFGLAYATRRLARNRPELSVGVPLAVGMALRLLVIAGVSVSGLGLSLRGGDENTFLLDAQKIAASDIGSELWFPAQFHRLHEILFALQMKVADFPEAALRVTQVGLAMLGILLIVAAIYDLAGPRAALIGAWVFAIEPGSVFFNGILHREPLLVLANGLVIFGGTKIWKRLELRGVLAVGLGCAIATGTRPYAGWFLITGGLLLILHASMRQVGTTLRSLPLIYGVAIAIAACVPVVLSLTSQEKLESSLQVSQNYNTNPGMYISPGTPGYNNLSLEPVEYSSRASLVTNLPRRVRDILLRPYPWQLANRSQQLGALGTLIALTALFLLIRYVRRNRGQIFAVAAPLIYPTAFLTIAYALSVGNAGTGFRYRTHLVLLGLAILVVLREHALRRREAAVDEARREARDGAAPVAVRGGAGAPVLGLRS